VTRKGFVALLTAEAISLIGSRMTFVALPWLVLVTTGSATRTGLVALAEMLPYVVVCAAGGPLIDRVGPRRTAVAMDVLSLVAVGSIPFLNDFGPLVALVVIAGIARGLSDTSKRVLFPRSVEDAGVDMTRATSIHDGLSRLATLIGAPLAGILIAATDAGTVLLIDAASFLAAAILVLAFVRSTVRFEEELESLSYVGQLREGVGYVRRDRLIFAIIGMLFLTNLLDQAYTAVFVPVWARDLFGSPVGIGLAFGAFAAGAVAGNLVYTVVAPRLPRWAPFAFGFLIGGAPRFVALATDSPLWTILSVSVAAGLGLSVVNPILGAVMYERVPPRMQARVQGLATALAWAGIPVGSLLGGWLVDQAGLRIALWAGAAVYLLATAAPFLSPVWRQMNLSPTTRPSGETASRIESQASPAAEPGAEDGEGGHAGGGRTEDGATEAYRQPALIGEASELLGGDAPLGPHDHEDVARLR
jgi:MFS family permease